MDSDTSPTGFQKRVLSNDLENLTKENSILRKKLKNISFSHSQTENLLNAKLSDYESALEASTEELSTISKQISEGDLRQSLDSSSSYIQGFSSSLSDHNHHQPHNNQTFPTHYNFSDDKDFDGEAPHPLTMSTITRDANFPSTFTITTTFEEEEEEEESDIEEESVEEGEEDSIDSDSILHDIASIPSNHHHQEEQHLSTPQHHHHNFNNSHHHLPSPQLHTTNYLLHTSLPHPSSSSSRKGDKWKRKYELLHKDFRSLEIEASEYKTEMTLLNNKIVELEEDIHRSRQQEISTISKQVFGI